MPISTAAHGDLDSEAEHARPVLHGVGVALDKNCVGGYCKPVHIAIYVNGKLNTSNPRYILLFNQREIAIVIGTPPPKIPAAYSNIPL